MNSELSYWKETKVMEVEHELADLAHPVSLSELVDPAPDITDLLSTSSDTTTLRRHIQRFSLLMDWVVYHLQVKQTSLQDLQDKPFHWV